MDFRKTNKITWVLFCFLLFSPIFIERLLVAPFTLTREPLYIWGTVHWIYCYIAYGAACLIYFKWRKKIDDRIILKPNKQELKWLCLAVFISVAVKYLFNIIAVFVFNSTVVHLSAPMIYRDFVGFLSDDSLLLGIGGFAMQYIYYIFEFFLIAFIVDCAQKTSIRMEWPQKIPWGGVFLLLTVGFGHRYGVIFPALRGEFAYSISTILRCMTIGLAYMLPGKKPMYAFFTMMAWYWL